MSLPPASSSANLRTTSSCATQDHQNTPTTVSFSEATRGLTGSRQRPTGVRKQTPHQPDESEFNVPQVPNLDSQDGF